MPRQVAPVLAWWLATFASIAAASCVTYAEELNRGQRHFQANEYEQALGILRVLERDIDSLPPADRARYAYFRGMTDYRMSLRDDARHWLALARAYDRAAPGGIEDAWRERMKEALKDLEGELRPETTANLPSDGGGDAGVD